MSPSRGSYCGSRQQTLLSCELRTAHTDTILLTVDIVFVLYLVAWCSVKSSVADSRR